MKTLFFIILVLAILFLSIWLTRAVYESDLPNWFKLWLLR